MSKIAITEQMVGRFLSWPLPPHQQRVLDEKQDLDIRITKLDEFIQRNALFRQLESAEQSRMRRQLDVMRELSVILGERIVSFQTCGGDVMSSGDAGALAGLAEAVNTCNQIAAI